MTIEFNTKGVTLNESEVVAVYEYYRHVTVTEYLIEVYHFNETTASGLAAEVIHLIDHREYTETEAISAVIHKHVKETNEKENELP